VKVNKDVRRYMKELIKLGFPHHCIVSPGRMSDDLEVFADQLEIEICRL